MNPLLSFFFTKSPHKTLHQPPSQSHSWKQSWFFFFGVKNSCKALYCHRVVAAPFFFFFFLSKKISQKHSLQKRNFRLKLSRTLMRVQRLTEYYGWSFNNGDLVLWVYNIFIFSFNKNCFDLNHENRPQFSNLGGSTAVWTIPCSSHLEFFLRLKNHNSERFLINRVRLYGPVRI